MLDILYMNLVFWDPAAALAIVVWVGTPGFIVGPYVIASQTNFSKENLWGLWVFLGQFALAFLAGLAWSGAFTATYTWAQGIVG